MRKLLILLFLIQSIQSTSQNNLQSVELNYFYELKQFGQNYCSDINDFTNGIDLGRYYVHPEFEFDSIRIDTLEGRLLGKVKQLVPENTRDSYGIYLVRLIDDKILLDTFILNTNINEYKYFDLYFERDQKLFFCLKKDAYYSKYFNIGDLFKYTSCYEKDKIDNNQYFETIDYIRATLNGKVGNCNISKEIVKAQSGIAGYHKSIQPNKYVKIIYFKMSIYRNDISIFNSESCNGKGRFSHDMKKGIEIMEAGDKLFFLDIKTKFNDCFYQLQPISFTIE